MAQGQSVQQLLAASAANTQIARSLWRSRFGSPGQAKTVIHGTIGDVATVAVLFYPNNNGASSITLSDGETGAVIAAVAIPAATLVVAFVVGLEGANLGVDATAPVGNIGPGASLCVPLPDSLRVLTITVGAAGAGNSATIAVASVPG